MASPWLSTTAVRWRLKPLVFIAVSIPFLVAVAKTLGHLGGLGVNPVETLMDHFGNWGLRFLLLALAITPLRQLTGQAWLSRFRRLLGLTAFFYILAHFLVYLILDQGLGAIEFIVEDIVDRPFITLGVSALLLLLAMALTSTAAARRTLGQRWQKLHNTVYLAGILGVWHYWWQVKKDITEPLIYALVLAALLGFRLWVRRAQSAKLNAI